jgi:hypothetical protein
MDIEICSVYDGLLQTVWIEEKGEGSVLSFASTVILCRIPENMTGADKDHEEIDARLPVCFSL